MSRIAGYVQIAFGAVGIALVVLSLVSVFDIAAISGNAVIGSTHDTYYFVPDKFALGLSLAGSLLLIFGGLLLLKRPLAAE